MCLKTKGLEMAICLRMLSFIAPTYVWYTAHHTQHHKHRQLHTVAQKAAIAIDNAHLSYTNIHFPASHTRTFTHTHAHTYVHARMHADTHTHTHTHSTHRPCISWLGRRRSIWEYHAALDEKPSTHPGSVATPAHDQAQTQESDIDHLWQLCREQYLKQ